jgi:flagellin-like hook-associated protein FlgL
VFDVLIEFRDALLQNDQFVIGGRTLGGLDQSLGNVLKYRAHMGAVNERMQSMLKRYLADESYYTDAKQNAVGTDITKATMQMKMLEFGRGASISACEMMRKRFRLHELNIEFMIKTANFFAGF